MNSAVDLGLPVFEKPVFTLNDDQNKAAEAIKTGKNLFISGPGGVGKSYLINYIKTVFSGDTIFLSPTGIAALNIGGSTIHSTFRLPTHILTKRDHESPANKTEELFSKGLIKRIVVDEISMVRSDVFVTMDQNLRRIKRRNIPFGGIQIIIVGDFFQLPPVVTKYDKETFYRFYDSEYSFATQSWAEADFEYVELKKVMRQSDEVFIDNLQKIRRKLDGFHNSVQMFNEIGVGNQQSVLEKDPVFICATNKAADVINEDNYQDLDGKEIYSNAIIDGKFETEPAPKFLKLKYGTKLMCTANNDEVKNGETGYFVGMEDDTIHLIMEKDESDVYLKKNVWEQKEYEIDDNKELNIKTVGTYKQFPVKHAWALTVHKCQGVSLDYGMIDKGWGFFAHGQAYVALSRLRTLEGLALFKGLKEKDIIVDQAVIDFYDNGCRGIGLF